MQYLIKLPQTLETELDLVPPYSLEIVAPTKEEGKKVENKTVYQIP